MSFDITKVTPEVRADIQAAVTAAVGARDSNGRGIMALTRLYHGEHYEAMLHVHSVLTDPQRACLKTTLSRVNESIADGITTIDPDTGKMKRKGATSKAARLTVVESKNGDKVDENDAPLYTVLADNGEFALAVKLTTAKRPESVIAKALERVGKVSADMDSADYRALVGNWVKAQFGVVLPA